MQFLLIASRIILPTYIEDFKNKMFAAQEEANDWFEKESYDSEDSLEISLSDDLSFCFVDGHDATMDDAYEDELAIVPYVKHEIVAIAPKLDCPIILLKSPTHIPKNCSRLRLNVMGCIYLMFLKTVLKKFTCACRS